MYSFFGLPYIVFGLGKLYYVSVRENRLNWIDTARGILVLFVVLTHVGMIPGLPILHLFMIPSFAVITGFLMQHKDNFQEKWGTIFLKKGLELLLWYFQVGLVSVLLLFPFLYRVDFVSRYSGTLLTELMNLLWGQGSTYNGPLWYFSALGLCFLWLGIILKVVKNPYLQGMLSFSLTLIAVLFAPRPLANTLTLSLILLTFIYLGRIFKILVSLKPLIQMELLVLCLSGFLLATKNIHTTVDVRTLDLGTPHFFFLSSFSGSYLLLLLSQFLNQGKIQKYTSWLNVLGTQSMNIISFHWPVLLVTNVLFFQTPIPQLISAKPILVSLSLPHDFHFIGILTRLSMFALYLLIAILLPIFLAKVSSAVRKQVHSRT